MAGEDLYVLIKNMQLVVIGINGTVDRPPNRAEKQQCYKSIKPFEFPGKSEGCTTEGDRPIYICCNAATECCTSNVDKC